MVFSNVIHLHAGSAMRLIRNEAFFSIEYIFFWITKQLDFIRRSFAC